MSVPVEVVRRLAEYPSASPALIVQTPEGEYEVSPDGMGGGLRNRYVISRRQLRILMWEHGIGPQDLNDSQAAARVADLVAEYDPATDDESRRRARSTGDGIVSAATPVAASEARNALVQLRINP